MIFLLFFRACKQDLNQKIEAQINYYCCWWWQWIQNSSGTDMIVYFDLWCKTSQRIWPCYFYIIPYQVHELTMTLVCDWAMNASFRKASNLDFRFQLMIELQHPGEVTLICLKKKKYFLLEQDELQLPVRSSACSVC